ncbi:MAG TPA: hypothetical protein PLT49_04140, partial [Ferruginibacter sp.]|nr:hypothetical protein [Ferruginibacter sp.]
RRFGFIDHDSARELLGLRLCKQTCEHAQKKEWQGKEPGTAFWKISHGAVNITGFSKGLQW